jgi:hypothetical protein
MSKGDVFEGKPDARQAGHGQTSPAPSLFRKRYRQLTPAEIELHDAIKDKADELAILFRMIGGTPMLKDGQALPHPDREVGANIQLGIRHLEDAVYRAVKALTA